ncbi:hypothetical protein [Ectobacillus panaciterrae]|uniref:hypothetical protein n=1 Tax=Ectobacillus panaciterrae TaxID=363872 RepID=UPI0004097B7D|nr:hypothetical protein [Ectobacillus panaciterrae]
MKKTVITQVIQHLKKFGFEDAEYCPKLQQFQFHNNSDIMNNYVTITYSNQFQKFSVRVHPIETSNSVELMEVTKRLEKCTQCAEELNALLEKRYKTDVPKLVI